MEKDNIFLNQMNNNYNVNELSWESIADQSGGAGGGGGVDFFESALSSMVSSPTASNNNANSNGENVVLRELIGRLGSICNNNYSEVSPRHYNNNSSCYSTPLNSPPKLNLSMVMEGNHRLHDRGNMNLQNFPPPTDPSFAERAARFSCFASKNLGGGLIPSSAASSCSSSRVLHQSLMNKEEQASASDRKFKTSESANPQFADSRENSTVINGQNDARKRKPSARAKPVKDVPLETSETNAKRVKSEENGSNEKDESANPKQSKDNSKTSEPPKDYIHVRARRGQATDAHSLAERVRREKISERMKLLQDLVPGCNKVTGKAVMLDEIINYVQSLQRQVEFLSMKLATINPRMDFNMESIASSSRDMFQQSHGSFPHSTYASDHCYYPFQEAPQANLHSSSVRNGTDWFFDSSHYGETVSQVSAYMEDDLHSIVQMGFQKNAIAQCFDNGNVMKVER